MKIKRMLLAALTALVSSLESIVEFHPITITIFE